MISITETIQLDENELSFDFVRAAGPGGQNVNKVATAVQLRFSVLESRIPDEVKERLYKIAASRINKDGELIIHARKYRTQEQNRLDAIQRLAELIQKAAVKPKTRRATRPSVTAKAARVGEKRQRGEVKKMRKYDPQEWE